MLVSTSFFEDIHVVAVSGVVDRKAAAYLFDSLVGQNAADRRKLVVDITNVHVLTRAAADRFVVAAKLYESRHGQMRIAGADGPVLALLESLRFNHLLKLDRTAEAAIAAMPLAGLLKPDRSKGLAATFGAAPRSAIGVPVATSVPNKLVGSAA